MKLNDTDKENIEVLESLDADENTLLGFFCRYFNYRYKRISGKYGYPPNQALQETIRAAMDLETRKIDAEEEQS